MDKYSGENRRKDEGLPGNEHHAFERIAERTAKIAVEEVFAKIGIDVNDIKQVSEFQKDIAFAGSIRRASGHSFLAAVGALTVAIIVAIGLGAIAYIDKG